jgi:hypothetical protein
MRQPPDVAVNVIGAVPAVTEAAKIDAWVAWF